MYSLIAPTVKPLVIAGICRSTTHSLPSFNGVSNQIEIPSLHFSDEEDDDEDDDEEEDVADTK